MVQTKIIYFVLFDFDADVGALEHLKKNRFFNKTVKSDQCRNSIAIC